MLLLALFVKPLRATSATRGQPSTDLYRRIITRNCVCTLGLLVVYILTSVIVFYFLFHSAAEEVCGCWTGPVVCDDGVDEWDSRSQHQAALGVRYAYATRMCSKSVALVVVGGLIGEAISACRSAAKLTKAKKTYCTIDSNTPQHVRQHRHVCVGVTLEKPDFDTDTLFTLLRNTTGFYDRRYFQNSTPGVLQ